MSVESLLVAIVLGVLQGIFEWLPISSEGNVALALAALGESPTAAVRVALSLHLGTALAATAYYRGELRELLALLPSWRPGRAFSPADGSLTFLAAATAISGVVGVACYVTLIDVVSAIAGGVFVAAIGVLLVVTGIVQRTAEGVSIERDRPPGLVDAVLVGVGQGLAILPGISRSGTTVSLLLLRGQDGEDSFRLSFLLSIPAAVGAGVLAAMDSGVAGSPEVWLTALLVSAAVGYLSIGALVALVERTAFWAVCVALGALAVVGGVLVGVVL